MIGIGIDLGTTYSCVAVWKQGSIEVISNEQGNKTTPSYVAFTDKERLIGEAAKNQAPLNPKNSIFGTKRLLGRRYDDIGVQMDLRHWPFKVTNDNGKPKIFVQYKGESKYFAPEEISGMVLYRMKQIAEAHLGTQVTEAVVTVPAHFNDSQRQATRTAGTIAGLRILRTLNEPTAAALAFGLDKKIKGKKNVLVYDLGGGTLDVSVLTIGEGSIYEVKSTSGNARLGGEDFDNRLVAYFVEDFSNRYRKEILSNKKSLRRLKTASEKVKKALTSALEATVEIESLYDNIDYYARITRSFFEELCSDLFIDTLKPVQQALLDAKMIKSDITDIILIGGCTRIPKIQNLLQVFFEGQQLTASVNPDEAVAFGAAIQAAILGGDHHENIKDLHLVDVVPLSLGIETGRGMMYKLIERNTAIPCQQTKDVTTLEDYQRSMTLEIFEGERALTKDNNLLGSFELTGIPPAPRGVPKIDVTFEVDTNGTLSVFAKDRSTGKIEGIVITNENRLCQKEVERMLADAEVFEEEDKENRRRLVSRNQLETYVFGVKQSVVEDVDNLTKKEKDFMMKECQEAILWLDANTDCLREEYEMKISELMRIWSPILKKYYDKNQKQRVKRQRSESNQKELEEHQRATIEELLDDL